MAGGGEERGQQEVGTGTALCWLSLILVVKAQHGGFEVNGCARRHHSAKVNMTGTV